uniref:Uncharacterized protein n=1 Tax=Amphimedon queenslandica TaxID=400682 RepID=A0A1X7U6T4_AMPQE
MVSGIILYQVPVITTPHLVEGTLEAFIDFQYNKYCIGTVPQLVLLHINNEKYNCSLVSPTTICTSIITADINDANVTINISKVLEYGTTYSVEMSLYTINNIGSNNFTFKFNIESYVVNIASPDVINSIPYSSSYVTFSSYDISSSYATCSSDYVTPSSLSEDAAIQSNEAYGISLPGKASGMMQSNIAYESISMALQTNAIYEQVDIIVYEKTK